MKVKDIVSASNKKDLFTIISDDETAVLLFEGKTVMAGEHSDYHSGHDSAYFNGELVKKSWKSPLELFQRIQSQFKMKSEVVEHEVGEDLFSFLDKNDLYACDECFC